MKKWKEINISNIYKVAMMTNCTQSNVTKNEKKIKSNSIDELSLFFQL